MADRQQLIAMLRSGASFDEVGRRAGIPAGQVYLIVTGLPADGSDVLSPEELRARSEFLLESSQHLANPSTELPKHESEVEEWIKARARADQQMHRAGAARSADPPPVEGAELTDDVIDVLGWDHNQVKVLQQQLQAIPGVRQGGSAAHQQRRVSIVDMIRVRLSQHETAEEGYFWPAVREHITDGEELAAKAEEQEQEGKDILQALDGLPGDADDFDELVEKLVKALRVHVAFEETVFLKVKQEMSDEQREDLGRKLRTREPHLPTRPHPHAPDSKVAAAAAAPLDKARDAMGSRPAHRHGKAEPPEQPEPEQP